MKLSIVIPVFNERNNLVLIYEHLTKVLSSLKASYEIIFIDDGSTDGSFEVLRKLHLKDRFVKVVELNRNYGQTAAISAGFSEAVGDVIITMDADLQNDPSDIPKLLEVMGKGYDVVSGWRTNRKDPLLKKKLPSLLSNWLARKLTGLSLHDFGCSLKAYKKETVKDLKLYGEMHRFIPALISMKGYKVAEVKVSHYERKHGKSKYGTRRLLKGFLDLIFLKFWSDYSTRPLHFFGLLGFFMILAGALIGFLNISYYLFIVKKLAGVGPLLILSALLFIVGFQLVFFGFLAEILIRNYYASGKDKPFYVKSVLK